MEGQDKTPGKQLDEGETGNLPEKEFRVMIVKMIQDLRKTTEKTYSFSLFIHSFYLCSPISPSLSFFYVVSQAFIKHSRKAFVYIYIINMYSIYIY